MVRRFQNGSRVAARADDASENDVIQRLDDVLGIRDDVRGDVTTEVASCAKSKARETCERDDPYDGFEPARDAFGFGPKWDVPWDLPRMIAVMTAIDCVFYFAGALAPVIVVAGGEADAAAFATATRNAFDDPSSLSDIFITAEIMTIVLGSFALAVALKPFVPLPLGWFNDVLSTDARERNASGKKASRARNAAVQKAMDARRERSGREAVQAILGTFFALAVVTAALYATGLRGGDEQTGAASADIIEKAFAAGPRGVVNLLLTTTVMAPVYEEIIFRGFLMASLTKFMPPSWAIALSAVIFALIHQHGVGDTAQLLAVGVACGIVYARTRDLGAAICVHAAFNGGVIALFALWTA